MVVVVDDPRSLSRGVHRQHGSCYRVWRGRWHRQCDSREDVDAAMNTCGADVLLKITRRARLSKNVGLSN